MLADVIPELELVVPAQEEIIPRVDQILKPKIDDGEERQKFVVPSQLSRGAKRRSKRSRGSRRSEEGRDQSDDKFSDSGFAAIGADDSEDSHDLYNSGSESSDSIGISTSPDNERSSFAGSESSSSRSRSSSSSSRRSRGKKKKGPNPAAEFIKIGLGGMLAIPIAYMLVLGVFRQDPLGLAPMFEKVIPFIVPKELKSDQEKIVPLPELDLDSSEKNADRVIDLEKESLPLSTLDPENIQLKSGN